MSKPIVFIQVHGKLDILEAELSESTTLGELQNALSAAGVKVDDGTFMFVDDADEHLVGDRQVRIPGFRPGCRIHVCRCRRIKVTVNYLCNSADHAFPPGARVKAVKDWAVRKFDLSPKDAAEHLLQICGSTDRPSSDTPLHQLVAGEPRPGDCDLADSRNRHCELCFDLVPDKRVEG